ncbi:MAG: 6,7-dimethyl-8-ribityllumazine synthase [Candidatus Nitrosocosmicus sp.]|nr:6,7-dimethyl-8-ribityllumazine synthase [Candidatus Nitrosocosmicus sp.]MDN5865982.1 6,7-dimethyl-8-ribityllumazine synthase [Candidatus Nitrosocosmicus sp.]
MKVRIGIVVSEFNNEITFAMLSEAKKYAMEFSSKITYVCFVPGVFDMPIVVQEILKKKDVDAVVTLGAIIKGDTSHDRLIANITAKLLGELSLKYNKPISLGITGPDMTFKQAELRIIPTSHHAVYTAIEMAKRLNKIRNYKMKSNSTKIVD